MRKFVSVASMLVVGCQLDAPERHNSSSYKIDNAGFPTSDELSFAFLDETRNIQGPNTNLFVSSVVLGADNDETDVSWMLALNIPPRFGTGVFAPRFSPLPSKEHIWAQYTDNGRGSWYAYKGELKIEEIGEVGARLKMRLDRLWLTDECGDRHVLEDGSVDVSIASEAFYSLSNVGAKVEWDESVVRVNESNVVLEFDDEAFVCDDAIFRQQTNPTVLTTAGGNGDVLFIRVKCECASGRVADRHRVPFRLNAFLPPAGKDQVLAHGSEYGAALYYDIHDTPDSVDDDEIWYSTDIEWLYRAIGPDAGDAVDIELSGPIPFFAAAFDGETPTLDPGRRKDLLALHAYGVVMR